MISVSVEIGGRSLARREDLLRCCIHVVVDGIKTFFSRASVSPLRTNVIGTLKSVYIFDWRIRNAVTQALTLTDKCVLKTKPVPDFVNGSQTEITARPVTSGHCFICDHDSVSDKIRQELNSGHWEMRIAFHLVSDGRVVDVRDRVILEIRVVDFVNDIHIDVGVVSFVESVLHIGFVLGEGCYIRPRLVDGVVNSRKVHLDSVG